MTYQLQLSDNYKTSIPASHCSFHVCGHIPCRWCVGAFAVYLNYSRKVNYNVILGDSGVVQANLVSIRKRRTLRIALYPITPLLQQDWH